ncbi:site-specific integrase, partial [[Clostridium] innocuum]|nr:site-specific integrase [[Clostridium] innocuum]
GKGRHYTNKTINLVTGTFNMIMNYAVKYGYIRSNPCANFESLKTVKTNDEIKFWTDTEFQKAIRYEDDFMWYCFLVLAYMTGMRKGEIRGLRWSDIDFDNHIISINRHISDKVMKEDRNTENEKRVIRGRKNGHAHKIAMDFHIENLLKELRKDNSFIDGWSKESYVFGIFKPIGQNSPKRHLDIIAKKAGIKQITVHGLRHSHVSYLISKGLNAYEIAERIGDTVEMVFKVYGHMFPNPQRNIVNVLNSNFAFIQERDKIKKGRQNERQHFPGSIKNPDIYGAKCYNGALNRT